MQGDSDPLITLTTRRAFMAAAARALTCGAVLGAVPLIEPSDATAGETGARARFSAELDVASLVADGQSLVWPKSGPDGAHILVVRKSARTFLALSMQCTHEGCPVNPPVGGIISCPCHGSKYDLDGKVKHGPAQYPLGRYTTRYDAKKKLLRVSQDGELH